MITNNSFKYYNKYFFTLLALFLFFLGTVQLQGQYDIPNPPSSDQSLVFDYANGQILNAQQKAELNQKLIDYEKRTSTQIAVVLVDSLKGEDINELAAKWGQEWEIGQKGKDNGLVIMLSQKDRRIALQNGYGLEEYLTDAKSKRIIDQFFIPYLKQGNYSKAFDEGTNAVILLLDGKFIEDGNGYEAKDPLPTWLIILLVGLLIYFLFFRNSGGNKGNRGKRNTLGDIIFTDFGRSTWMGRGGGIGGGGFGGGGFGGGGFGGFGGGGFGGGGASGGW